MELHRTRWLLCTILSLLSLSLLGGCSLTRYDRLVAKGDKVESNLKLEQRKALTMEAGSYARQLKLQHLTSLRNQLSAANVGLSGVKNFMPADKKEIGYDVIEQVYDTIDWNIPLTDGDPAKKPLPAKFTDGSLQFR